MAEYQIWGPDGELKLSAPESCRYSRQIEIGMVQAGYTIRLHEKKVTKTELRKDVGR